MRRRIAEVYKFRILERAGFFCMEFIKLYFVESLNDTFFFFNSD